MDAVICARDKALALINILPSIKCVYPMEMALSK